MPASKEVLPLMTAHLVIDRFRYFHPLQAAALAEELVQPVHRPERRGDVPDPLVHLAEQGPLLGCGDADVRLGNGQNGLSITKGDRSV
jgi:hypothetical protein